MRLRLRRPQILTTTLLLTLLPATFSTPASTTSASQPASSALVSSLPPCYQSCISQSPDINCPDLTNIGCLCRASNGNFLTDVLTCVKANCDPSLDVNTLLSPLQLACQLAGSPISPNAIRNAQDAFRNAPAGEPYTVSTTSATYITTNSKASSYYVVTPVPLTLYLSGVSASVKTELSTTTVTVTTTDTVGSALIVISTKVITSVTTSLITTTDVVTSTRGLGSGAGADLQSPSVVSNGTASSGKGGMTGGMTGAGNGQGGGQTSGGGFSTVTSVDGSLSVSTQSATGGGASSTGSGGSPFGGGNNVAGAASEAGRFEIQWVVGVGMGILGLLGGVVAM